ncbi:MULTISPECIES: lipoprotein-releasing ABC transporter permease subunit [unclassified Sphingopyxis]|jgi:lipoprotein-releasing system permease protein|uniref:lipoprotein-releasing ABC transporter permease subunit n=1 Tax=unclassified Sphingopyxis TaxID=2614943 RepID=UPI0006C10EF8|nr:MULTISPECIES: lipoprotein-releasing ABC transporter permease subunit [unclassified Sphingopyxis]USI79008.1 lipoprotein-releasing ABC transporter permease subunit [Sphingopyxis sp. USTB-05]GAO78530.1 lipoprotein releasing system transmembrane protein LolE [Sphingopyxis sp. C-1]
MILRPYERTIFKRYLLPQRGEGFIFVAAAFSFTAVMLGVAALVIVMSVMNGVRSDLFDKIVGLNGHAVVQGFGGRIDDWQDVLKQAKATPGVVSATPLIEQPLLGTFSGRVEGILVRGMTVPDIRKNETLNGKVLQGSLNTLTPGSGNVAIGSELARNLGATVGSNLTIINPAGRSTPFGTVPREISYRISAIFEIGVYDFDKAYVVMPMEDAQLLLLTGDQVQMIEVKTSDPDKVGEILRPLAEKVAAKAVVSDWRSMNASLFEALSIERVAMFVILSLIILVASFNIISSLIMLVRAKTRDMAILRTMGAPRDSVMRIFMAIGLSIGIAGTIAGMIVGFSLLYFRQGVLRSVEFLTGQPLWDPSIRFLTELPSKPDPVEITAIVIMVIVFSFLATLYPAYKAANTDPVQVLRYE